ncbi:hypothetical protein OMAG_002719 [Candidatus Omnitrophus magneticus]|uniref:Uncharacterized protein n=1 Tax=Candidatus Omnitrophus magneticus TaxID=1609969 RepID=A0A0F0CJL4_9BACT|nr:hypothetical protein OMAG_002719 [Candidatus Omnitrophus magneticus]
MRRCRKIKKYFFIFYDLFFCAEKSFFAARVDYRAAKNFILRELL